MDILTKPFGDLSPRKRAVWAGVLILVAYGVLASMMTDSVVVVMAADVISGLAVIGIAMLLVPLFISFGRELSYAYLLLRLLEGAVMVLGGLVVLDESLRPWRDTIYTHIQIYFFLFAGIPFYVLLYRSHIIPRFISVWGMVAIAALFLTTLLKLFGIQDPALDALMMLIVTNEVFLAIWLMAKGFRAPVNV